MSPHPHGPARAMFLSSAPVSQGMAKTANGRQTWAPPGYRRQSLTCRYKLALLAAWERSSVSSRPCPSLSQLPSLSRVRCVRARQETAQRLPQRGGPLTRKATAHPELLTSGLMTRGPLRGIGGPDAEASQREPLAWDSVVERVTRIELALSAWESYRSGALTGLSWAVDPPLVTVTHPATPGLMAR